MYGVKRLKWFAVLPAVFGLLLITSCGGNGTSNTPASKVQHRSLISNTFSGNLQVVDIQNDTTQFTPSTTTSTGQVVPGVPVTVPAGTSVTFEAVSSDMSKTLVYDQSDNALIFITNSTEAQLGTVVLAAPAQMALFSPDGNTAYAPVRNVAITGQRAGGVQVVNVTTPGITTTYPVPSATYIALSPSGQYLLVFADNSDSVFLIDLQATTVAAVEIPGFARPVNAFFSSDSNTAYVLNCAWECGSTTTAASVAQLDIPSLTIKASVVVGGASVGLLKGTTLYVAGTSQTAGPVFDVVNVGNMTRTTANSIAITDGLHTTMGLTTNNKLYIGAITCSNQTAGCLSVVDLTNNTADAPLPPKGSVTGMLAIPNRDVIYVIEGGYLQIYDTDTDTIQKTQIIFQGALYGVVQVDPE